MGKIKVKPEGRENIYLPEKKSLIKWIKHKKFKTIHNFIASSPMLIGADHKVESVILDIEKADRVAIFTNNAGNLGHNLSIIKNNKLECYDIGVLEIGDISLPQPN